MEAHEKQIIKKNLRSLPISNLCEIAGLDVIEMMEARGVPITNNNVIDTIIQTKGFGIFNNKTILKHFVELASDVPNINSWSSSNACKKLLESYGLSENFLRVPQTRREPKFESTPDFILHNYQDDIKKQTSNFLLSTDKKLMVQLPTGAGKTSMTVESLIDFFRLSDKQSPFVVWMAHTDELCEQAIEAFDRAWKHKGTYEISLIRLWGGNAQNYDRDEKPSFIVTSFQSAYSMIRTSRDDVFSSFNFIKGKTDILVVDEAHMSLAPTYNDAIELFSNTNSKLIGLTATPGRHGVGMDNEETLKLAEYYDNNIINMNHFCGDQTPVQYLQSEGILSKVSVNKLVTNFQLDLSPAEQSRLRDTGYLGDNVLRRVGEDAERNNLIFEQIKNVVKIKGKKTLVFASSVENSDSLAAALHMDGVKARSVTGETFSNDRRQAVEDFQNGELEALINFNIFSTGFDDPTIDCVIIARPTFSVVLYSQMVGRGLRGPKNGGTENCLLINVIDNLINLPDIENACNFFDSDWEVAE